MRRGSGQGWPRNSGASHVMILSILVALAAQAAAPAAPPAPTPPPIIRGAPPRFLSGPQSAYPEAEQNAGHHGKVMVSGLVGLDGRFRDLTVVESSGVPALDQSALDAARATLFTPGRDAQDNPVEMRARMPFYFARYRSTEPGAALRYTCAQWVQDMDWWRSVHPNAPWGDHELYQLTRGAGLLGRIDAIQDPASAQAHIRDFERRWERGLEACRRRPQARMLDQFDPERATIERLVEMERRRAAARNR